MNALSHKILDSYQVRMRSSQKKAFIELLKAELPYEMKIEKTIFGGRNLIFGDPNTAKYILTAHYDTAPVLPFPNFLTPKNMAVYIGFMLLICLCVFAVMCGISLLLSLIFGSSEAFSFAYFAVLIFFFSWMFIGKPNKHTANDNTSGVITLLEALQDEKIRENCCIVLFDLEEMGLFGSSSFASKHKSVKRHVPVINFDCVGEGDDILIILPKKANNCKPALEAAFISENGKQIHFESAERTLYPSDQSNFKRGIGVAAFKKNKFCGYYMNRIHTKKDTVCEAKNIELLVNGLTRLVRK